MKKTKQITNAEEHKIVIERITELMSAKPGTREADELESLSQLAMAYERSIYSVKLPGPIEAIKFRMEQAGLKPVDLVPYIGSRSKVSEVLNGKRPLSVAMMRRLHKGLGIPAECLLNEPGKELPPAIKRRLPIRSGGRPLSKKSA